MLGIAKLRKLLKLRPLKLQLHENKTLENLY